VLRTVRSAPDREYDACFFIHLYELGVGYGDAEGAANRLKALRKRAGRTFAVAMDCAQTHWFEQACDLCEKIGVETLVDLGFHDQSDRLPEQGRRLYHFAFNGLTDRERAQVRRLSPAGEERRLPWVFVGRG
jgi:hypothetical protein